VTAPRLRRRGAAPPVRLLHLGLGNFFRAHQAWYTDQASPGGGTATEEAWGIAAFGGRSGAAVAAALNEQGGLYTLVTRDAAGDEFGVVGSLAAAYPAADQETWLRLVASPSVTAVTVTVTEAGYLWVPGGSGGLRSELLADVAALRGHAGVATAPGRLVAGFAARRRAGAGPLAVVPCDNLPANGEVARQVTGAVAELVDPGLAGWIGESVSFVSTVVDRVTPRPGPGDAEAVAAAVGADDRCPVVTEPFHEWILAGAFPAGRPRWELAGARLAGDLLPFEHRKLWLLNGAHSLLAYAGLLRGHATVAEAFGDETCRSWADQWWDEASAHLGRPAGEVAAYREALAGRFANPRIAHRLDQIAADGSQKLRLRTVPVVLAERAAGRGALGGLRSLAAWVCHLRGGGGPIADARAGEVLPLAAGPLPAAAGRLLGFLDERLAADGEAVRAVVALCRELGAGPPGR
jgi:fructuronate reductase